MDKRYQVFVSSTYSDLKEERQKVIQALMEMDCIPAGMELFPAADEEQWEFIKKVINDCDYYILIIGGRYGSLTNAGISYTEKEYDYAVERGIKVIAILHSDPDTIPSGKSEKIPELKLKLEEFKGKVKKGRLVRFWKNASELPGIVALSLQKTIKMYPALGWVRANLVPDNLYKELHELRHKNEDLENKIRSLQMLNAANESDNINFHASEDINAQNAKAINALIKAFDAPSTDPSDINYIGQPLLRARRLGKKLSASDRFFSAVDVLVKDIDEMRTSMSYPAPAHLSVNAVEIVIDELESMKQKIESNG